jgi:hypothetical protein
MANANSIKQSLDLLSSVSDSLNKASDLLTARISEVEAALQRYRLGIDAWVPLAEFSNGPVNPALIQELGYGRYGGKWGLLVVEYYDDAEGPEDEVKQTLLRESSRDIRLAAVDKLPDLIQKIVQEAQKVAEEAALKAEKTRQIAASLSPKPR